MKAGWTSVPLLEACEAYQPKTIGRKDMTDHGPYPVFGANGIIGRYRNYNHEEPEILLGCRGSCGSVNVSLPKSWVTGNAMVVRPRDGRLTKDFLRYFLDGSDAISKVITGVAQPQITQKSLAAVCIPLPPLEEQRRIVAVLDEAFAAIATATANAEKNLASARKAYEAGLDSYVENAFRRFGSTTLDSFCSHITDGDHSPPPKADFGIPFVTISNINKRTGEISFEDTFFVPYAYYESLKHSRKPEVGDLLYTVTGATLGVPSLVLDTKQFCFQRHIAIIKPNDRTSSEWLLHVLRSPNVFRQATLGSTGTAQKTVSLAVLRSLKVPKADNGNQVAAAAKLTALFQTLDELASLYGAKLALLRELKKSFLHRAFTGELTAITPDLIPA